MAALRSVLVAGSLLTVAAVMAPACGGRDALLFDDLEGAGGAAGPGQGGFNQGGAGPDGGAAPEGGAGGTPFVVGGFGGMPNTMVTSSVTNGVTTVGVTTVGVTTSATSGVTSSVATSGVTTVTTGVTTSVTSGNSTSAVTTTTGGMSTVVTTSGMGGFGGSPSGGMGGFGGSPTGGGGFTPIDCISCINSNCPQAQACLTNPSCISGIVCTIGTCIQGNNPPNFACVLGCFNGDFMAAFQALGAITCIGTQCGQECQGAFSP